MQALLEADDVYGVYEVHNLSMVMKGITTSSEVAEFTSLEIEQLLARFNSLFYAPATLPPHRIIDHRTHFLPNTKPVNVRPYRYPYYQKGKMEKLVKEMMEQDYRALNEVIVKDKFPITTANEMFDELGGAIIFTKLDLRAAHLGNLECVLNCLQEHQFYIKRSKCVFEALTLEYLGHIITGLSIEMDLKKVAAVHEWPVPVSMESARFPWVSRVLSAFY
nr:Ty3/gypsy retrotransposon protein [Tanacetum cinerariifolium]